MTFSRTILEAHAAKIMAALLPYCRRMQVTGALRREDANGSSLDFVCISDDPAAVTRRALKHAFRVKGDDRHLTAALQNGVLLRIWFARPECLDIFEPVPSNFETLLTMHTPTRYYLKDFTRYIQSAGYILNGNRGLITPEGRLVAHTEASIYDALNIELPGMDQLQEFRPKFVRDLVSF